MTDIKLAAYTLFAISMPLAAAVSHPAEASHEVSIHEAATCPRR